MWTWGGRACDWQSIFPVWQVLVLGKSVKLTMCVLGENPPQPEKCNKYMFETPAVLWNTVLIHTCVRPMFDVCAYCTWAHITETLHTRIYSIQKWTASQQNHPSLPSLLISFTLNSCHWFLPTGPYSDFYFPFIHQCWWSASYMRKLPTQTESKTSYRHMNGKDESCVKSLHECRW